MDGTIIPTGVMFQYPHETLSLILYRDGAYWGPADELAKEILDFAHHMYLLTLDHKLHLAPLRDPQTILDCGTGTGIWAIVGHLQILGKAYRH
jgi:hypothetical protein